ncbi:dihydrofolate reductase [Sphingomonas zeicaulis]|uniref:dihydrofolate reductase family protein n=1 Tax=Sphingomonas zeicaulis TaxID=1632740 RepID=UPI003D1F0239
MGRLIVSAFTSLDGYIEPPTGFEGPAWSAEVERHWSGHSLGTAKHLIYGRVNFQFNAGFWSDPEGPAVEISYAPVMNALPKTVFSRTLTGDPGWNATIATDVEARVAQLKAEIDGDIYAFSGAQMVAGLVAADVVDEYMLMLLPVLWGGGKRLFGTEFARQDLTLIDSRTLDTGAVILRYARNREGKSA